MYINVQYHSRTDYLTTNKFLECIKKYIKNIEVNNHPFWNILNMFSIKTCMSQHKHDTSTIHDPDEQILSDVLVSEL